MSKIIISEEMDIKLIKALIEGKTVKELSAKYHIDPHIFSDLKREHIPELKKSGVRCEFLEKIKVFNVRADTSGKVTFHIDESFLKKAAIVAQKQNKTLEQFLRDSIQKIIEA